MDWTNRKEHDGDHVSCGVTMASSSSAVRKQNNVVSRWLLEIYCTYLSFFLKKIRFVRALHGQQSWLTKKGNVIRAATYDSFQSLNIKNIFLD